MICLRPKSSALLCIALLGSASLFSKATSNPKARHSRSASTFSLGELTTAALAQLEKIESIFDTIGQSIASGASNIPTRTKSTIKAKLQTLRTDQIGTIKKFASVHETPEQLYQLVLFNAAIINVLDRAISSNLRKLPAPDIEALQGHYQATVGTITPEAIEALIKKNNVKLIRIDKESQAIGLSGLNAAYRNLRKFEKDYSILFWLEHAAVYSALLVWYTYVTSSPAIAEFPLTPSFAKTFLLKVKGYSGSVPKTTQTGTKAPINLGYTTVENGVPTFNAFGTFHPYLESREIIKDGAATSYKGIDTTKYHINIVPKPDANGGEVTVESPSNSNDHSFATTVQNGVAALLSLDCKTILFTVSPGLLFANYIKQDATRANERIKIWKQKFDDRFFGTAKKNSHEEVDVRTERFKDIVGREDVKAELLRVIEYICHPDRFDRAGIKVERGYLLAGKPQTGKTLIARALAGEITAAFDKLGKGQKMRLFDLTTDDLVRKGIGHYMHLAKSFSPCILFLDELDLMRLQRDGDSKALSEFLTVMSGSLSNNEKDQVIILAATNKPENLDFALRQHGRFGKMFWFDNPTFKHRVEFFVKECEKRCMNANDFNFILLAQQTENCSFGTLDIVFKSALMHAKMENTPVAQAHFEKAIDLEVRKLVPSGYSVSPEKEAVIATRQAGKALVNILLAPSKMLCTVTILPITQELEEEHVTQQYHIYDKKKDQRAVRYGNIFAYHLNDALDIQSQDELVKQCKILLASNAAQKVYGLDSCAFDKVDKQQAFELAKLIMFEGLEPKEMAKEIRNQKLTEAYRLLEAYEADMVELLTEHKAELVKLVEALQKHKTLSIGQINELLGRN